jgi:hypothetical protein
MEAGLSRIINELDSSKNQTGSTTLKVLVPVTQTFTCSLAVEPDGTGSAVCPLDDPLPGAPPVETFDFVLEDKARAFRLVGTTPNILVLGSGSEQ